MPIRTASMKNRIAANGLALHRAKEGGMAEDEAELAEERRALKDEREKRKAKALLPGPSALDRLVRTHHPEAKSKPARKEAHAAADAKKPKARKSRAEKHAEKAAAVEAARRSPKKPVK
jgi:hypothetical protein